MAEDKLSYNYTFRFHDGREKSFSVELDNHSLNLMSVPSVRYPEWTLLKSNQCPVCPLDAGAIKHCPAAVAVLEPVTYFKDSVSYEKADVTIETPARSYSKQTTLQEGLGSLMGIFMVGSGCPVLEKLKPMVRFHLPFATEDETKYRVMAMYLLAQSYLERNGGTPDWRMEKLSGLYDNIRVLNKHFAMRLQESRAKDAALNALICLDCFAITVRFSLDTNSFSDIEHLFTAYLS